MFWVLADFYSGLWPVQKFLLFSYKLLGIFFNSLGYLGHKGDHLLKKTERTERKTSGQTYAFGLDNRTVFFYSVLCSGKLQLNWAFMGRFSFIEKNLITIPNLDKCHTEFFFFNIQNSLLKTEGFQGIFLIPETLDL